MKNKQISTAAKLVAGIGVVGAAFAASAGIAPVDFSLPVSNKALAATERVQTPSVEVKLVEVTRVKYIDEVVEEVAAEPEYRDVIREVPAQFRNFHTLQELKQWMNRHNQVMAVRFGNDDTIIDCDDYAIELQMKALGDGYIVSFEIIGIAEYNGLFTTELPDSTALHAINLAIIENDVYYIEPQTGEIVIAASLD